MTWHASRLVAVSVIALAPVLAGCSSQFVPVQGQVKFKDGSDVSVLAGYSVTFEPAEGKVSAVGEIAPDGTFTLTTMKPDDGVMPGTHKVAITPPQSADPDKPPPKSQVAQKYHDISSTDLNVTVAPGQKTVLLELERAR